MIVNIHDLITKNNNESFVVFLKEQLISIHNQLEPTPMIDNNSFLDYIRMNKVFVYVDTKFNIKGCATLFYEKKLSNNGKYILHINDIIVDKKFRNLDIGKEIIERCKEETRDKNVLKSIIRCPVELRAFFTKFDFKSNSLIEMEYYSISQ